MLTPFQRPKLDCNLETLTETYGCFYAQPFERGFGTTVGNSIRRALYSSMEGAAITAVRIEGVLHEFSSIPGVVEDATDIILNLKRIPFKITSGKLVSTLRLKCDQPGEVYSRDIEVEEGVEVLESDAYIATVSEGGSLNIEMRLKMGRGYVSADRNFDEDLAIGYIPIDSVHSPIKRVRCNVESARLGQDTDYEKLILEVWTNGSIKPADSIGLAAKLVKDHMSIFINFEETEVDMEPVKITERRPVQNENLDRSVEELELSVRSYNCLKRRHKDYKGACTEKRTGDVENQELWAQISQRNKRDSGSHGTWLGGDIRRGRKHNGLQK